MSNHHKIISITNSWQEAWSIFSRHFLKFLFITAIPLLVAYIFLWSTLGSFLVSAKSVADLKQIFSFSSSFIYFAAVAMIIVAIIQIWSAIALLVTVVNHENIKIGEIFYQSLSYFWSFILLSITLGFIAVLIIICGYVAITIIYTAIGLLSITSLNRYYVLSEAIPAILTSISSVFLIFSPYFLIDAKTNFWVSIRKSFRLVRGFFWPIAIRLVIAYSIISTIMFIFQFIPYVGYYLALLISIPLLAIYDYVLYRDLVSNSNALKYSE